MIALVIERPHPAVDEKRAAAELGQLQRKEALERVAGQFARSVCSEISRLTGAHVMSFRNCTNQVFSRRMKSNGRNRIVPSANFWKKDCVPPPRMWPPPTTAPTCSSKGPAPASGAM